MSYILHDGCVHTCMTKILTPDMTNVMTDVQTSACTLSCRLHASVLSKWLKKAITFQSPCGICWSYLQFSNHMSEIVKGNFRSYFLFGQVIWKKLSAPFWTADISRFFRDKILFLKQTNEIFQEACNPDYRQNYRLLCVFCHRFRLRLAGLSFFLFSPSWIW